MAAAPAVTHPVQRPAGGLGAWLGIVVLFFAFGLGVAVLTGLFPHANQLEEKRAKARAEKLKTMRDDADKALHNYAWVDKAKGSAKIPIERAMELTVAELSQKKPESAGPIATPAPAEAPAAPGMQAGTAAPAAVPAMTPQPTAPPKPASIGGVTNEPAAALKAPGAAPGTQPGASATPAATPGPNTAVAPVSPTATPVQSAPGTPIPVAGKTPPPSPSPKS